MPDEAEAVAAPGSTYIHTYIHFLFSFFQIKNTTCPRIAYASLGGTPPFMMFIANVSLPQKFDTKGNLAANWMDTDLESV